MAVGGGADAAKQLAADKAVRMRQATKERSIEREYLWKS
jgi:hypothetical protein